MEKNGLLIGTKRAVSFAYHLWSPNPECNPLKLFLRLIECRTPRKPAWLRHFHHREVCEGKRALRLQKVGDTNKRRRLPTTKDYLWSSGRNLGYRVWEEMAKRTG